MSDQVNNGSTTSSKTISDQASRAETDALNPMTSQETEETPMTTQPLKLGSKPELDTISEQPTRFAPLPGNRPIGTTDLKISNRLKTGPLPGNRPIEASQMKVNRTLSSASIRPIMASNLDIKETFDTSGHRPVSITHLNISQTYTVMGNRPVADNDVDLPDLMGYID